MKVQIRNANQTKTLTCQLLLNPSQVGNKKALAQSAVYPRQFGVAMSELMQPRLKRSKGDLDFKSYPATHDMGALDDLLRGRQATWWRKLWLRWWGPTLKENIKP